MNRLLLTLALLAGACGVPETGGTDWLDDLERGFALAAETGRPLLIVFR